MVEFESRYINLLMNRVSLSHVIGQLPVENSNALSRPVGKWMEAEWVKGSSSNK